MSLLGPASDAPGSEVAYLENAIKELELGNDEQIGSCLRDIFQNHDSQLFLRLLNDRIAVHDSDIEKVCHYHFEGFMDSFQKLMDAKKEAAGYKEKILEENARLIDRCQDYLAKTEELVQAQKLKDNISETLKILQSSMPIFEAYRKLKSQATTSRGDYYQALKILDDLQKMIPTIAEFKWSQSVVNGISAFRESVKKRCLDEIKNFLEQVATRSYKIGLLALLKSAILNNAVPNTIQCLAECDLAGEMKNLPADFTGLCNYLNNLAIEDIIDFLPIYRGIHIYEKLESSAELSNYYQRDKRKQLFVIMDTTSTGSQGFWLPRLIFKTLGFFVVEDHVLNTSDGLIDVRFYNELRDKAVQKLLAVCRNALMNCANSEQMLSSKVLLTVFASTIPDYGFTPSPFNDVLFDMQNQYIDILLNISAEKFQTLMEEGNYTPVVAQNQADIDKLAERYSSLLSKTRYDRDKFPVTLPFSPLVPKLHEEICNFARKLLEFYKNLTERELLMIVRQPMERLLSEKLLSCFMDLISDKNRTLTQLIQLCINAYYLTDQVGKLDKAISRIFGLESAEFYLPNSYYNVFSQFRDKVQEMIVFQLKSSVDQFLELSCYDWTALESNGTASPYIVDLLRFLRTTFASFNNLPSSLFQPTLTSTSEHVAKSLLHSLYNPEVKAVSYPALEQLELDLIQCEQFVVEMCVTNADVDQTMSVFLELRQLLDLVLTKDWAAYFLDYNQKESRRYDLVTAKSALTIVEKLREGCKKTKGLLSTFRSKQSEKDEKKLLSTVSEELQKLMAQ